MSPRRWVLASGNAGKLAEIAALLGDAGVQVVPQTRFAVEPAEETAVTFIENALIKARHAARLTRLPALADDSGLAVDALDGAPGVRSARFAGERSSDAANVKRLLEALDGVPEPRRGACFYCVLVALRSPDDPAPVVAQGQWRGRIASAPAGSGGFGYDPVFFDPKLGVTAAQMPREVKNRVSHRARALRRLSRTLAPARA